MGASPSVEATKLDAFRGALEKLGYIGVSALGWRSIRQADALRAAAIAAKHGRIRLSELERYCEMVARGRGCCFKAR
jgi:hypothetical protein